MVLTLHWIYRNRELRICDQEIRNQGLGIRDQEIRD
jgi:hypothetical protein